MTDGTATLAIDLGGTRIKAGLVEDDRVDHQRIVPTEDEQGFDRVLHNIIAVSEELIREHPVGAIGLSLPAIVDAERGIVVDVRKNLAGLIGFPFAETLRRRFGLPVAIENDARLYGLGEMIAGAGRGVADLVCLTLGTGVGCCVVSDGYILRGRRGTGGILGGHMTIEAHGPRCSCGNIGCVEALCSAVALVRAAEERVAGRPGHPLNEARPLTPEAILAAARGGDVLARDVVSSYTRHLAAAVVSYIHVHDPDLVLLGGGVMNASDQILPPVQRFVRDHTWTSPPRTVPVRAATLGDGAALIGAAALATGRARFR